MKRMTKFQTVKCTQITEKLIDWDICSPFIEMIDPEQDGAPNYYDIIHNPMCLAVVRTKLARGEYHTIESWSTDINQIWENAITYNGEGALFTQMALEAQLWFQDKLKKFPESAEQEWTMKMRKVTAQLMHVVSNSPFSAESKLHPVDKAKQTTP